MTAQFRRSEAVSTDFYETGPKLVDQFVKVVQKHSPRDSTTGRPRVTYIDPSVGKGVIYSKLPSPKLGYDIESRYLTKHNQYTVKDFLKVTPNPKLNRSSTVVATNPPFRSKKSQLLVVDFLNHAAEMSDTVVFIVPLYMNKLNNIQRVTSRLALTDVYYLPKEMQVFENSSGERKKVGVCIQVWKHTGRPSFAPRRHSSPATPSFELKFGIHRYPRSYFDFYVKIIDSLKNVGKISAKYPYSDPKVTETRSWMGVKIAKCEKRRHVSDRFRTMFDSGEYVRLLQNTSSGNYYQINQTDLMHLFHKSTPRPNFKEHFTRKSC